MGRNKFLLIIWFLKSVIFWHFIVMATRLSLFEFELSESVALDETNKG